MPYKALLTGAVSLLFIVPALAQTPGQPNQAAPGHQNGGQTQQQAPTQQQTQALGAKLRQSLQGAGFTDIQVMPSSFLVRAKDRDGNPVMMVVNPDSVAAITEIGGGQAGGKDNQSTTGRGSSSQNNSPAQKN